MRLIVTAVFFAALAFIYPPTVRADDIQARVLVEDQYFSNLDNVIQDSGVDVDLRVKDAHRLLLNIADFRGLVQLDQSRWLALNEAGWTDDQWNPDFECAVVFVVDKTRAPAVKGWQDLLESDVPVAISHYETSLGQNTILACAFARGGDEGNLTPAFTYFRSLYQAGRLYEAGEPDGYQVERAVLAQAPVVIVWDYQATAIKQELGDNFVTVFPEEGTLKIQAGLSPSRYSSASDGELKAYMQSEKGRGQLRSSGFCPVGSDFAYTGELHSPPVFYTIKNHGQWTKAASNLKASWRRQVRLTKLYPLGSRSEMMVSSLLILFLLIYWSASMYMRMSPGLMRRIFTVFFAYLLWLLLLKLIKLLTIDNLEIWIWYLWYAALPAYSPLLCLMCYAFIHERMPPGPTLFILIAPAVFLSLAALTNDLHQGMLFLPADRADISLRFSHGWIYWATLFFQAFYILWGIRLLLQLGTSRHRKKQAIHLLFFTAVIISFPVLYVQKVPSFYDLDLVDVLIFLLVIFTEIQARGRMFGINYAIRPFLAELKVPLAALNESGEWIYINAGMKSSTVGTPTPLPAGDIERLLTLPLNESGHEFPGIKLLAGREFHPLTAKIAGGYSLVLEDRSEVEAMVKELAEKQTGLKQSHRLLKHRHYMESILSAAREKAAHMGRLNAALSLNIRELAAFMTRIDNQENQAGWLQKLHYARFLAGYCHRRLRISIMSLNHTTIDFNDLAGIFQATIKEVENLDINAYLSVQGEGRLHSDLALLLHEALFLTMRLIAGRPGLSLYARLRLDHESVNLFVRLPLLVAELVRPSDSNNLSFRPYDLEILQKLGGKFEHLDDDDSSLVRMSFKLGGEETV